jgi:hypothetical protein
VKYWDSFDREHETQRLLFDLVQLRLADVSTLEDHRKRNPLTNGLNQSHLQLLSESTGGLFQRDHNDMTGQIKTAVEDAGGYYLLAWYSGAEAFKRKAGGEPAYHDLEVKVLRKGLTVRSRQGFFAVPGTGEPERALNAAEQMREALFSPFRSGGLDVQLTPSVVYDLAGGASVESLLRIRTKGIEFHHEADGCRTASLELLTAA